MKDGGQDLEGAADRGVRRWGNLKLVLIALFGAVAGQAVVWYTGQFYALFFLERMLKVDGATANILIAIALVIGTPFFILFGWLSDKIGRKPIILAGCALAALTYFPLFRALTEAANPALAQAQATRAGDGDRRSRRLLGPVRSGRQEQVRQHAAATSPSRRWPRPASATPTSRRRRDGRAASASAMRHRRRCGDLDGDAQGGDRRFQARAKAALEAAGYPAKADPAAINKPLVVAILFLARALGDHGLRADRGAAGRAVPDAHPLHLDVACPITSATAGSAASCRRPPSPWSRRPAISTPGSGTRSGSRVVTLVVGLLFLPETFRRKLTD